MRNNTVKYLVAALLFVDLCSLTVLGLILGYVIPTGPSASKVFLGLHRHEWGDIHFTLAISILVLVAVHVWQNWDWVSGFTKKFFGQQWQKVIWILSGAWFAVIVGAWIIVKLY